MPARVDVISPDEKLEDTDDSYRRNVSKKIIASESSTLKQLAAADDRIGHKIDVNQPILTEAIETLPVPTTNIRTNLQIQPENYAVYSRYESYGTPPFNLMAVSGNTIPAGQQVHPYQPISPYQLTYQPSGNPCDGGFYLPKEQIYPMNYDVPPPYPSHLLPAYPSHLSPTYPSQLLPTYPSHLLPAYPSHLLPTCTDMHFCKYALQLQPPSVMSYHPPYQQDESQRYSQQQQPGLTTLRTTSACPGFQEDKQEPIELRCSNVRCPHHPDSTNSSMINNTKPERYYNCGCQSNPTGTNFLAPKQPRKKCPTKTPVVGTESANHNLTKSRTAKYSSDDLTRKHGCATTASSNPDEGVLPKIAADSLTLPGREERQRRYRETHLSSDSGWISDNSSNREDGELGDDATCVSPSINEISNRLDESLRLENRGASSLDDSYQESPFSPLSSQCPSSADDSDHQHVPTKKHSQQPRIIKAIPLRFMNLLQTAAQNAAMQRKKLEGYPLFRRATKQRNSENQHDQVFLPEMPQLEFDGIIKPQQSTSWYFPGRHLKCQYYQGPGGYTQGQYQPGPANCVQDLNIQCTGNYTQGQYQQLPASYFLHQYQGNGSYAQSQYQQDSTPN